MGGIIKLRKNVIPHLNLQKRFPSPVHEVTQTKKVRNSSPVADGPSTSHQSKLMNSSSTNSSVSKKSSESFSEDHSSFNPSPDESDEEITEPYNGRRQSTISLLETKSRFYLGIPEEIYHIVEYICEIGKIRHVDVLISLKKIRTGHVYQMIADDFEISTSLVQKIFKTSVPKIASCVQNLIIWPDSEKIVLNLPISFRHRYKRVESIIDCFEIEIQKPSNPVRQALTWSEYKKCNTIKFLISSTPNGVVNYVSGAFGGRTADKEIVEHSGYLEKLHYDKMVMADRGFKHIEHLLSQKRCRLVRPPSVPGHTILSKEEVKESKKIASLRIHVERVIRRLREFEMLEAHAKIHPNLLYLMNHIVIIACGLVNVQGPLIQK